MHDSLSIVTVLGHSHLRNFRFRAYTSNYARVLRCEGENAMELRQMNNKYCSIAFTALHFCLFIFFNFGIFPYAVSFLLALARNILFCICWS